MWSNSGRNIDLNAKEIDGQTAFFIAFRHGYKHVVKIGTFLIIFYTLCNMSKASFTASYFHCFSSCFFLATFTIFAAVHMSDVLDASSKKSRSHNIVLS